LNNNPLNKNISSNKYPNPKDRSLGLLTIAILCFFIGFGLIIGFYGYTLIGLLDLSKFIVGFMVLGFLIPLKLYSKWFHFIKYEVIIFNILGVAPFFTGVFLVLNFIFASQTKTTEYLIEKFYIEGEQHNASAGIILENNTYSEERKIVELTPEEASELIGKTHLKLTISKGLFGFEIIKDREFLTQH
jgi:cell division septal protein FtsQ